MVDRNIKILVVDDFATIHRIIRGQLKDHGFTNILDADDGKQAISLLKENTVDLILSDWSMPEMTGIELLKAVKRDDRFKHIPFIMVTAEGQNDNVVQAVQNNVDQYIMKPFSAETLMEKINNVFP